MAATHTWATAKAPRRKSKNVKQAVANGNSRSAARRFVQGALHFSNTMRKPKSNNEGKDRLKALAAAAARAAGANLTTYFADDDGRGSGSGELPPADQAAPGRHNGAPIKLVPSSAPPSSAPPQQPIEEASPQQAMPMSQPQQAPQVGEPQVTLRLAKPEEAEVVAKQSARMARLITSGDGTLIQAEPSTSGELPPHIGPLGRENSLEFLPVLPPMHIHSHPVTTGHGQFGQTPPQVFVRPEDDPKLLPKIVLSQAPGGRSPPMNRAGSGGGPNSPPPQVTISVRRDPPAEGMEVDEGTPNGMFNQPQPGGNRRRQKHPGLPPLAGKSGGKKGKRAGICGAAVEGAPGHSAPGMAGSVAALAAAALHTPAALPPGMAIGPMQQMLLEGGDVQMAEGSAPLATQSMKALSLEPSPSGSVSPFANAPAAQTSSEESDTESDEKQASAGPLKKRRSGSMDAAAGRPAKRAKKGSAARAASLNTVLAAVEERAGRAGSGAMDASVGCAPTTVEDCLKASSFGTIRKDKRTAKPRTDGSSRVWGSTFNQVTGAARPADSRPMSPPSSQPIASLSSSESAAAISLLALAPGTPPGMSSPVGTPTLAPSASGSDDFGPVHMQAQLSGPTLGAAQSPPGGQGQGAEPMDSDMAPTGQQGLVGGQQPQPVHAAAEGGALNKQQPASAQDAGTNGSAGAAPGTGNGQGAGQGGDANGAPTSAGLPIAPLRLDSGLQAQEPGEGSTEMSMGLWSGKLKHRMATAGGYSTVDLLNLTALIPDRYLEQLPPTLFVTELLARSAVQMSKHYIVQCRLGFLTDRQLTKLQLLANSKLVAVCQLQHCKLTLVPYLEARSGQLRLMGFLIADDLGT